MHDMIGASGMLRGWAMVWHTYLVWLLASFVLSVAAMAVIESLIETLRPRLAAPKFVVRPIALDSRAQVEPR